MTRDGVAQLETGRRGPTWETALALSDALGVSCEEFRKKPQEGPKRPAGWPPKRATESEGEPAPKRPRGRPRKGG
jgi:hypothetical protein